ncbi:hypothetical protein IFM89_026172 [Coptis chinensis]|uniref:DNA-directed RNA polymerase V subunit 5A n=1 Tax=Coptis chinensis TaxID=261450 RepID=A0A835H8F6_9MAGN|nr:hypothetical protein IFM89_026172 [Coptis chinensis]
MEQGGCLSAFIDPGSVESHRYYLARRTTLEMLRDRGYDVPDADLDLSLQAFRSTYGQSPNLEHIRISLPLLSDSSKKILVIFCGTEVVKLAMVRNIFNQIANSQNLNRLILILQNKITAQARQALAICRVKTETFQITDLLVNIMKHFLMPKHELLNLEEKEKLLKKYSVGENQIPRMLETDAVARYYGLEKGQVVKVTSDDDVAESHATYRCVT